MQKQTIYALIGTVAVLIAAVAAFAGEPARADVPQGWWVFTTVNPPPAEDTIVYSDDLGTLEVDWGDEGEPRDYEAEGEGIYTADCPIMGERYFVLVTEDTDGDGIPDWFELWDKNGNQLREGSINPA